MALKLGTLLIREGVITPAQLDEALKLQSLYGGRIGTSLIEANAIVPDVLAKWLSQASGYPAATNAMLEVAPKEVVDLIPPQFAEHSECYPFKKDGRRLLVALTKPADLTTVDTISFKTSLRVVPYIVPEYVFYNHLEKRYGVTRKARYAKLSAKLDGGPVSAEPVRTIPPPPPPDLPPVPTVTQESPTVIVRDQTLPPVVPPPPQIVREQTLPPAAPSPAQAEGFTTNPRWTPAAPVAPTPPDKTLPPGSPAPHPDTLSLPQVLDALGTVGDRNQLAEVLLRFAADKIDAFLIFLVRNGQAVGWKGRNEDIHAVHVSLNEPSLFQRATDSRQPVGGPLTPGEAHEEIFTTLNRPAPASALVVPVVIQDTVVNLLYVERAEGDVISLAEPLSDIAAELPAVYARLLRANKAAA